MKSIAQFYKALGDESRLKIVEMLIGRELCVCDIMEAFHLSQPAVSHHLRVLKQAGVVTDKKEGKWIYYSLNKDGFIKPNQFWENVLDNLKESVRIRQCD